jgi:hypothetical protein
MKIAKILSYFTQRLAFIVLLLTLLIINAVSLKPEFFLLGWDNYSSYLNLTTNFFRTLFATWREYRGLGVPSDSEVVDLTRQLFFILLSPLIAKNVLDQIYILLCLNLGVIGMYFFASQFFRLGLPRINHRTSDAISFMAAFFYLFNLNTLATFYFPMIMYVSRFACLPILLALFLKFVKEKRVSLKTLFLSVLAILFFSESFLTATIFLTLVLMLFIYGLSVGNYRKQAIFYLLFIGLNLFWLLPFANYTWQKSGIIRLAPTFIEANEIQLNKPASTYALPQLLILYPNFFYTKLTDKP